MKNFLWLVAICGMAVSCGTIPAPKGFDQQLAEAYGLHTAVVQAATVAHHDGTISTAEAVEVEHQAQSSRAMLDAARAIEGTNTAGATNDLTLATTALTALQSYLRASGAK
jgi:hypothetical protein